MASYRFTTTSSALQRLLLEHAQRVMLVPCRESSLTLRLLTRKDEETTMSTKPLRRLGKYDLQERLGQGGMAEVWKALDTQLQRYVAIKLLRPKLLEDPN